jgi:hypothetical protein
LGDLGIDGTLMLKRILHKSRAVRLTGFSNIRLSFSGVNQLSVSAKQGKLLYLLSDYQVLEKGSAAYSELWQLPNTV